MKKTVSLLLALVLAASLLPGAALAAGSYTAAMPMDQSASVGEETALRLVIGSADSTDYAAAYLVLSYDAARLAFTGCSDASYAVNDAVGTVTLARYGASASFGAVTLTFRPIAAGDTTVRLTAANIDAKGNANVQDAPPARILDAETVLHVAETYTVTLPDTGFTGRKTAPAGRDYTFATDPAHYDYADLTVTVGGTAVTPRNNGDGTYTVPGSAVAGNITVTAAVMPKSYTVTVEGAGKDDVQYGAKATYGKDYVFRLVRDNGYTYTVNVTMDGRKVSPRIMGDTYTIPGQYLDGAITITVGKTASTRPGGNTRPGSGFAVIFDGSGADAASGEPTASAGQDYTFRVTPSEFYAYELSAQVNGENVPLRDNGDGTYTITGEYVAGPITVRIDRKARVDITVTEYVKLKDKCSVWLVRAAVPAELNLRCTYDGEPMYYAPHYGAYAWLILSGEGQESVERAVSEAVGTGRGVSAGQVFGNGDCDLSGFTRAEDAQFAQAMYNARHESLSGEDMLRFLESDTNADGHLDMEDGAAIVWIYMHENEEEKKG